MPQVEADQTAVLRIRHAVDRITKPEHRRIDRDPHGEWVRFPGATVTHGIIPSLWELTEQALTGSEHDHTGPGGDPAERNICDLDLMEIRGLIRDTTRHELGKLDADLTGTVPQLIRRLASQVVTRYPAELWWWEYRFTAWARLLATYLGDVDRVNRVRWLHAACPTCGARGVVMGEVGQRIWQPALLQDFRDGHFRGISCQACGAYWFVGRDMHHLAEAMA